jgi:glutathione S-transferase
MPGDGRRTAPGSSAPIRRRMPSSPPSPPASRPTAFPWGRRPQAYVDAHLADPAFRRFRAMGLVRARTCRGTPRTTPAALARPRTAPRPRGGRPSENAACPYSGKPVTHFLEMDGRTFGFCNAFCRDKTMADPEAWPAFMAIVNHS